MFENNRIRYHISYSYFCTDCSRIEFDGEGREGGDGTGGSITSVPYLNNATARGVDQRNSFPLLWSFLGSPSSRRHTCCVAPGLIQRTPPLPIKKPSRGCNNLLSPEEFSSRPEEYSLRLREYFSEPRKTCFFENSSRFLYKKKRKFLLRRVFKLVGAQTKPWGVWRQGAAAQNSSPPRPN